MVEDASAGKVLLGEGRGWRVDQFTGLLVAMIPTTCGCSIRLSWSGSVGVSRVDTRRNVECMLRDHE